MVGDGVARALIDAESSKQRGGSMEHQACHPMAKACTALISEAQHTGHGTVTKIGLTLRPLHSSYRSRTIPLSVFLFLYNEGP